MAKVEIFFEINKGGELAVTCTTKTSNNPEFNDHVAREVDEHIKSTINDLIAKTAAKLQAELQTDRHVATVAAPKNLH